MRTPRKSEHLPAGFCPDLVDFSAAVARRIPVRRIVGVGLPDPERLRSLEPEFETAALDPKGAGQGPPAGLVDSLVVVGPLAAPGVAEELIRGRDQLGWAGLALACLDESRLRLGDGRLRTRAEIDGVLRSTGAVPMLSGHSRTSADDAGRAVLIHYLPGRDWAAALAHEAPVPSVLAVVPAYNELDVLPVTLGRLLDQGIRVHVLDNWSTDGSWDLVSDMAAANPSVTVERFPLEPGAEFEWGRMLDRLDEVGAASDADWILHVDADEQFEAYSPTIGLRSAIGVVDTLGYDAIDFTVVDFRPTSAQPADDQVLPDNWEFGNRTGHLYIHRAWRNRGVPLGIAESGGHIIPDPKSLFPFNFVLRHYPLRSPEQALQKIYKDRLPRLDGTAEKQKGWHRQYDGYRTDDPFLWDAARLNLWDGQTLAEWMVEFTSRAGLTFGEGSYAASPFAPPDTAAAAEAGPAPAPRPPTLRDRLRRIQATKRRNDS